LCDRELLAVERFRRASESFGVTHALAMRSVSRPRKINDASCKSGLFSVAYESAEGKFNRP
jgi:hypothetical protein